jgi:hypothetical protein
VGEGELGRRDRVARRRVHDDDAALGGGVDVDVVDADPGAADDLEERGRRDHLGRDLGLERTAIACTSFTSSRSFAGEEP